MAGEWTPIEHATLHKDEIVRLVCRTGRDRFQVLGLMVTFWIWAELMTSDGRISAPLTALPEFVGGDLEFWRAVHDVGWIELPHGEEFELMVIPRAEHWLTKGAKSRLQNARRQAALRSRNANSNGSVTVGALPTGEKRTEQNSSVSDLTADLCSDSESRQTGFEDRSGQILNGKKPTSVFHGLTDNDLKDTAHLAKWVHEQAVSDHPVFAEPTIDDFRNVVASAEHAIAKARTSPVRLFASIVGRKSFNKISKSARDRAEERVVQHNNQLQKEAAG